MTKIRRFVVHHSAQRTTCHPHYHRSIYGNAADPYTWLHDHVGALDDRRRQEISANAARAAGGAVPGLADPDLQRDLLDLASECLRSIVAVVQLPRDTWVEPGLPVAGLDFSRALARRGISVLVLFKVFRAGHSHFWASIMDQAELEIEDPRLRMGVLRILWERLSRWMDFILDQLVDVYEKERDRWLRGALARRAETVEAILSGEDIAVEQASTALGHDLRQQQTAFTIRAVDRDTAGSAVGALEGIAAELAGALGASRAFTMPSGAHALWAWVATPAPPERRVLEPLVVKWPAVWIAVGRSAKGIEGFRRSHREAVKAQRAADAARVPRALTLYESVELESLLATDRDGMQAFVASELGAGITSGRTAERLLETGLAFLQCNGNASATANVLGVHRNTVRNRVRRAEDLLGRRLDPGNVSLQLALQLFVNVNDTPR